MIKCWFIFHWGKQTITICNFSPYKNIEKIKQNKRQSFSWIFFLMKFHNFFPSDFKALCILSTSLPKICSKLTANMCPKTPLVLKVSFCYGPRPWCSNSSKKWLNILLPLAGQQNDDDVGTAVFHEKKNSWKWLSILLFCFFNDFIEGQYSISRINLGI